MSIWFYRQDFAKFSLIRNYKPDDAFLPSVPIVSPYTPQATRVHPVARRTEDLQPDEDHVHRASGMGSDQLSQERHSCGQARKRTASRPSPVDYWILGERVCSGWFD
ncbi:hypothetical protein TNCV_2051871 [Trichonephila clavipes]|nr:hypothetical protein TNCV_2051871 [Trichonephila clavipes]